MFTILCLYVCVLGLTGAVKEPEGVSTDVEIQCVDCEQNNGGVVGGNITLKYTFKQDFIKLTVIYNSTKVLILRDTNKYRVDNKQFDDDRLIFSRTYRAGSGLYKKVKTFTLSLIGLTIHDNRAGFVYTYDKDVKEPDGSYVVKTYSLPSTYLSVRKPGEKSAATDDDSSDSTLIIIIVVVSIVVLIGCLLVVLLKSGVFHNGDDHMKDPRRFEHGEEGSESYPLSGQQYPDEKIYATPGNRCHDEATGEQQTEYAEVGPGGGRLGDRNEMPAPSVYAQVKTESGNYPDLQNSRRSERL